MAEPAALLKLSILSSGTSGHSKLEVFLSFLVSFGFGATDSGVNPHLALEVNLAFLEVPRMGGGLSGKWVSCLQSMHWEG